MPDQNSHEASESSSVSNLKQEKARSESAWTEAWNTGIGAAKSNLLPGLALWLFGTVLIAGYFLNEAVRELLNSVGDFKESYGWKFSLISTAIFGGLIPEIIAWCSKSSRKGGGVVVAGTLLWAYKGVEIDFFYQLQAWLFGDQADLITILAKTICDQFVMVPAFGLVNVVLFYAWRDCGYSLRRMLKTLTKGWYQRMVLPVLIANWAIWIPAVALIYSLPLALQLPVQNLILCFWVLILMFFTRPKEQTHADQPQIS
ncbi:MAG: Mpv17/PMP22 family protein [Planctomycetota bacterium]